ncbi:tRNA dihydrouridine(16) synthase DusC [Vibrio sp. WJH972]
MRVVLGPMQGVLDHVMREILTEINDYDLCVTEFVRVTSQLLPSKVFHRLCPELRTQSHTRSGTRVHVQLLGQDPQWMAENAHQAVEYGAAGIDINFGCPAKTVNKHKGGAALLEFPETIYQIVKQCRTAVDSNVPVTAKIRLGIENPEDCFAISDAIQQAGADELTIHARTKVGGYKAEEIKWGYIEQIRQRTSIPIIANGEIWNYQDGIDCRNTTNVDSLMVCRGALTIPNLGNVVKRNDAAMAWDEVLQLLINYSECEVIGDKSKYYPQRVKQWFTYLRHAYPEAAELFYNIRTFNQVDPILSHIHRAQEEYARTY